MIWFVVEDSPAGTVWIDERNENDGTWSYGDIQGSHGVIVAEYRESNGGKNAAFADMINRSRDKMVRRLQYHTYLHWVLRDRTGAGTIDTSDLLDLELAGIPFNADEAFLVEPRLAPDGWWWKVRDPAYYGLPSTLDPYTAVAMRIYDIEYSEVTEEMRDTVKRVMSAV
jgi:hypothetical protein